jgi:hypothetical protein
MKFEISIGRLADIMSTSWSCSFEYETGIDIHKYGEYGSLRDQEPTEEIANAVRKFLEDE